jgi:hypothetical protein
VRRIALLLVALAAALAVAAPARADGDPASDYLLGQMEFVPPDSGISKASAARLATVVSDANAHGFTVRVALIASRYDMGSITELWKRPKIYARFLGQELKLVYHGNLLIVMPNGYATSFNGVATPKDQKVVDRLPLPQGGSQLADAAVKAVVALAARRGIVITPPAAGHTGGHSANQDRLKIIVAVAVALLLAGAAWFARRLVLRRRAARA